MSVSEPKNKAKEIFEFMFTQLSFLEYLKPQFTNFQLIESLSIIRGHSIYQ